MQKRIKDSSNIFNLYVESKVPAALTPSAITQQITPLVSKLKATDVPAVTVPKKVDVLTHILAAPGKSAYLNTLAGTNLPQFNYKQVLMYLDICYDTKQPLLIYGEPGLGKSTIVKMYIEDAAKAKGREPFYWNTNPDKDDVEDEQAFAEKLKDVLKNPSKYFVFIDQRAGGFDPTDIGGVPLPSDEPYLKTVQQMWIYCMGQRDSDGILFLDEVNHANEYVINSLHQVIDGSAGATKFSKNWSIVAASNLGDAHGNAALKTSFVSRFLCGSLVIDPDGWFLWAERAGINDGIVGFVRSDPSSNFYVKPTNESDAIACPRQFEKLSKIMESITKKDQARIQAGRPAIEDILQSITNMAAGLCGSLWSQKFSAFLEHMRLFTLEHIMKHPNLKKESADKLHAMISFLSGKIKHLVDNIKEGVITDKETQDAINTLIHATLNLSNEMRTIIWSSVGRGLTLDQRGNVFKAINNTNMTDEQSARLKAVTAEVANILRGEPAKI